MFFILIIKYWTKNIEFLNYKRKKWCKFIKKILEKLNFYKNFEPKLKELENYVKIQEVYYF